jgi:hypothetical protein
LSDLNRLGEIVKSKWRRDDGHSINIDSAVRGLQRSRS